MRVFGHEENCTARWASGRLCRFQTLIEPVLGVVVTGEACNAINLHATPSSHVVKPLLGRQSGPK